MKPVRSTLNSVDMKIMMVSLPGSSMRANSVYNTVCVELWNKINDRTVFMFATRDKLKNETC